MVPLATREEAEEEGSTGGALLATELTEGTGDAAGAADPLPTAMDSTAARTTETKSVNSRTATEHSDMQCDERHTLFSAHILALGAEIIE